MEKAAAGRSRRQSANINVSQLMTLPVREETQSKRVKCLNFQQHTHPLLFLPPAGCSFFFVSFSATNGRSLYHIELS